MQAKLFGGLRDVAVEVIEDALDVFPFDTREGRYWDVGVPCGTGVLSNADGFFSAAGGESIPASPLKCADQSRAKALIVVDDQHSLPFNLIGRRQLATPELR